jgi:hypothetical protein
MKTIFSVVQTAELAKQVEHYHVAHYHVTHYYVKQRQDGMGLHKTMRRAT